MAEAAKTCSDCGKQFRGRVSATYCSAACKQRAHRARKGAKRRTLRLVTDTSQSPLDPNPVAGLHSERARAVLAALDEEQLAAAVARNLPALEWSAREAAVRELVASTIDRIADLERLYESATTAESADAGLLVKISTELRLQSVAPRAC